LGCQEPFGINRHDLGPFRIAAVGVVDGVATASVWSGHGLFHDEPIELAWYTNDELLGIGWEVEAPTTGTLLLEVSAASHSCKTATVSVGDAPNVLEFDRAAVNLGNDLSLQSRRDQEATEVQTTVASGEAVRLSAPDLDPNLTLRWMIANGEGTILELEQNTADFLAEDVVFDGTQVEERTPLDDGVYHVLALAMDGLGGNRWTWVDAAVGSDDPLIRHNNRLLPIDVDTSTGLIAATLTHEDSITGIGFESVESVENLEEQDALSCGLPNTPFELSWLADGRCIRSEVVGARVVMEVQ